MSKLASFILKHKRTINLIRDIFSCINICLYIVTGILNIPIFAALILINLFLLLIDKDKIKKIVSINYLVIIIPLVLFIILRAVAYLTSFGDLTINYVVDQFRTVFAIFLCLYYLPSNQKEKEETNKWLIYIPIFAIIVVCVRTTITLIFYPNISRYMATGKSDNVGINTFLVASYDLIYGFVFFDLALIYSLIKFKQFQLYKKILLISFLCVVTVTIFLASFSLAIFILLLGVFLLLFYSGKRKVFYSILIVALVLFYPLGIGIIYLGHYLIPNVWLSERIIQLGQLMTFTLQGDSELSDRFSKILESIKTFINNPVFGVGGYYTTTNMALYEIGGHSTLSDDLARYGLFVGLISSFGFLNFVIFINKKAKIRMHFLFSILLVLLGIINPIHYCTLLIYPFCIVPLMVSFFELEKNKILYTNENTIFRRIEI